MTPFPGRHIFRLSEASSTNTVAMHMLADSPPDGSVVLTYHQKAGKGQKGNHWEAKPGLNLTFSLICYPSFLSIDRMFELSKITCLAVKNCVEQWLPTQEVLIKWPNDVLLNGKKVAGILIENQLEGTNIQASIIGIGLNINQVLFSSQIANRATSMALIESRTFELEKVLQSLLTTFDKYYIELQQGQYASIDRSYLQYLYGYQEAIPILIENRRIVTPIIGIDKGGRMALMIDGRMQYFDIKEASIEIGK
ncbi:MAG: biotin--[acetyl-CoA-carboxylase] ligase [Bacteroidota bacterium]